MTPHIQRDLDRLHRDLLALSGLVEEMIQPVTHRPRARLDLLEQFVYLGEQAGVDAAERF